MTNELQLRQADKKTHDHSRYFQSLLAKASAEGLIGNTDKIRHETIELAADMAQKFTFGASSSVTVETAQGLLESAMYCIGRRLKDLETGEAINELQNRLLRDIWNDGKQLLLTDLGEVKLMLSRLQESALITENAAYNGTLREALPSFYAAYDIEYAAHETPCLIDYPLCTLLPKLTGAEYILEYIKALSIENSFCIMFSEHIEPLMRGYSPYWRDLNINIFELVLTNAIGRVLCGKDAEGLNINAEDRERLQRRLELMSKERIKAVFSMASQRVCPEAGLPQTVWNYAQKAAEGIAPRLKNALEAGSLGSVFITLKAAVSPAAGFEDAAAMGDEEFRAVTDEIRSCRFVPDKLALINRHIKSIGDLADMLGSRCLFGEEYDALFRALDDETLALLYKRLPEEGAMHITEAEIEWHSAFTGYLKNSEKEDSIKKAASAIEFK